LVWNGCVLKQLSLQKNKLSYPEIIRGVGGVNHGLFP
jgi:hypothetical protein